MSRYNYWVGFIYWKTVSRARTPKHTHDQYYLVIVIKMLVLGLQEGRKRRFLFLPRPRTNILYTIRKNLLLGGSGASLLPPNKDSSFTCITRVNRSLVGRGAKLPPPDHQRSCFPRVILC